jgi:peroxiredoxin family protein
LTEGENPPPRPAVGRLRAGGTAIDTQTEEQTVRRIVREEIEAALEKSPDSRSAAIIASKGTLAGAYPALVVSTAAAAAGMDVAVLFTFQGLNIVHKDFESKLAASEEAPMVDLEGALPGMQGIAATVMRSMSGEKSAATIRELLGTAQRSNVRLIACRTTMEVFGYTRDAFLPGVELGTAADFLSEARRARLTLFI